MLTHKVHSVLIICSCQHPYEEQSTKCVSIAWQAPWFLMNETTHPPLTFSRLSVPLTVALINRQNGARNGEAVHD